MKCCATCLPISCGDLPSGQEPKYALALLLVLVLVQLVSTRSRVEATTEINLGAFIFILRYVNAVFWITSDRARVQRKFGRRPFRSAEHRISPSVSRGARLYFEICLFRSKSLGWRNGVQMHAEGFDGGAG